MNLGTFISTFNSREKAITAWLLLFLVWLLLRKKTRDSALEVVKAFFQKKVISVFVGMLIYTVFIVALLYKVGLWDVFLIKDTIFWILGTAFVLLMNTNKATKSVKFFKGMLIDALKLIIVLEFIINFYTFNFWIEMILVPTLVLVGGMSGLVEVRSEYKQAKRFIDSILAAFGIFSIVYALVKLVSDYQSLTTLQNLRSFLLPPILTVVYVPYLYLFALFMAYENLFIRLKIFIKNKELLSFAKWRILFLCHLNLSKLNRLAHSSAITKITSKRGVQKLIKNFKICKDGVHCSASRKMNYSIKVSHKGFDVVDLNKKRSKKSPSKKALPNLLSSLALPYLLGAKKQVKRYRRAASSLQSQPKVGTMECMHEASNLFEDLNTMVVYMRKCGEDHKYHQLWQDIRNHIRHAVRDEFDKENDEVKNDRARRLRLDPKLQINIGFDRDAIKIGETVVEIDEITAYLIWAEDIITKILVKAKKNGFLKKLNSE